MNKKLENFFVIVVTILVLSLLYLLKLERDEVIAKDQAINKLRVELLETRNKNIEQGMIIEGYENKLSKFHISNLEQVGLPKKEE